MPQRAIGSLWLRARPCFIVVLSLASVPTTAGYDGQAFKASEEEADRVWNDPGCARTKGAEKGVDWDLVRTELHKQPFPESVPIVLEVARRIEHVRDLEREAVLCPFGVTAVLFFLVKFFIEVQHKIGPARVYFSLLESYASGFHPALIERADWLIRDSRITSLRRAMLKTHRPSGDTALKRPAIFVYDREAAEIALVTQGASFCGKGQWGMEVHIHEWLLASPHLTHDPEEADFFFVPGYGICMFEGGFLKMPELDAVYKSLVRNLPYFSAHRGQDHIFTFGSGMSANVFMSWREEISDSIFLTPETSLFNDFPHITEPPFDTWKDIAIPGYVHRHEAISLAAHAKPLKERKRLAVFFGRIDSSRGSHPTSGGVDVRAAIRALEGRVFVGQNLTLPEMHERMGDARFCFVPKGKSAWSLRLYEALFAGCVPVVLSDHWELPFEDFLDLPSFVIKWPMEQVNDAMVDRLEGVSDETLQRYMDAGRRNRCWYLYPPLIHETHGTDPNDDELRRICPNMWEENAFEGIMRQLYKKRRVSRTTGSFFGPGVP